MERVERCGEKLRVSLSTHVPALLAGAEDTATSPDMSMTRIRATLTEDDATAAKKLFHALVMSVWQCEPT